MFSSPLFKIVLYALPAAPMAALYFPVFVYLSEFYSFNFGISISAIGITFLLVRLFDGFIDPIIGFISDKLYLNNFRRRLWLIIALPVLITAIWHLYIPKASSSNDIQYFVIWLVFATIGWSIFITPYYALGVELTDDYQRRSTVAILREAIALIGTITAACIYAFSENSLAAFRNIAYFVIITLPCFTVICVIFTKEKKGNASNSISIQGLLKFLKSLIKNKSYFKLIIAYFINGAANGLPAALFIYFVNAKLGLPDYSGVLLLVYFITAVLASPIWIVLSKYFSKPKLWCFSMIYASIIFFFVIFIDQGDFIPFLIICCLSGAALGADLGIPASIQADLIEIDKRESGENKAGMFFAIWSILTKSAVAISSGVGLILLSIFEFSPNGNNSESTLVALTILYCILPIVLKSFSIAIIWTFSCETKFRR